MNKKFLSAILFGALMVSSTGTFVSCKDYDDDIKDLQEQINSNKDAIAALQKLVGEGKWVTNISSIENGFSVTMSDGTTTSITGIKGADGKNGTEWTIGEDGFWYKDGEKTASQAVAKDGEDGKAGATAPSPKISADGFWVVYEWDADKGEFVEKTTEISAQGTGAYVVKKDGVYVLHIADETGAFQDVTLPATSDSFVAEAPAALIKVTLQEAKWKIFADKNHKERLEVLTKAFPEIANYKKDDLMKQGGNLPVLITPANVELTNNFSFSLQGLDGKVSSAVLSNPVKGLVGDYTQYGTFIETKAAKADDCLWTLSLELEKNKKGDAYVDIEKAHSLVIENEKGTVVRTAFAYLAKKSTVSDVTVEKEANSIAYADEIDVFAVDETTKKALFTVKNGMNGHFVLEVAEPADVEKYGITIEGSKLKIANFPTGAQKIIIRNVKVTALGLNGSTDAGVQDITVTKKIEAESSLSDKTVTLSTTKNDNDNKYWNNVRWNVSELNMTAADLENFVKATPKTVTLTWTDEDDKEQTKEYTPYVYDKDGQKTSDYKAAVTFGFDFESKDLTPKYDYAVLVQAGTIYAADANLKVVNPTSAVIALYPELVNADGVLQIVGNPSTTDDKVTYTMVDGIKYDNAIITINKFVDMDADENDAATSWIKNDQTLEVYQNGVKVNNQIMKQLYVTRNFKAEYTLFGNSKNVKEMEFQGEVVSEIYNSDATAAIVMDASKLSAIFSSDNKKNTIDLATAVTKAIVAAGPDRGKTYSLFDKENGDKVTTTMDYSKPKAENDILTKGTNFVVIAEEVWAAKLGYKPEELTNGTKLYFKKDMWNTVWSTAKEYYNTDGSVIKKNGKDKEVKDDDKDMVAIFKAYKSKIDFDSTTVTEPQDPTPADSRLKDVKFTFADVTTAAKYVTSTTIGTTITAKASIDEDIPGEKVELPVNLTIVDQWGMKMVRTFNVTLSTK